MAALTRANLEARKVMDIEHVTPYINRRPDKFKVKAFICDPPKKHLRWTLDYAEDFDFIKEVYDSLYSQVPEFITSDIDQLLSDRPELLTLNSHLVTAAGALEGLRKSAKQDGLTMVFEDVNDVKSDGYERSGDSDTAEHNSFTFVVDDNK